jgi:hypothetical protein
VIAVLDVLGSLTGLLLAPLVVGLVRGKDRIIPLPIDDDVDKDISGIRCPACKWRPSRTDTWTCNPGCGEVWNTFATRGECPGCQRRWVNTQCTRCGVWSEHDAWYERPPDKS